LRTNYGEGERKRREEVVITTRCFIHTLLTCYEFFRLA
jgi:hypothetical protein